MDTNKEKEIIDTVERLSLKSIKIIEQTAKNISPNINNLINSFEKWLDQKLTNNSESLK